MSDTRDVEFLEYVVKELVDTPEAVKVDRKVDEMGVLITLDVDSADMGKIIGKSGNTAKAIRTLLRVVGMKNNSRVNLKINEPEGSSRPAMITATPTEVPTEAPAEVVAEAVEEVPVVEVDTSVEDAMEDLKSL